MILGIKLYSDTRILDKIDEIFFYPFTPYQCQNWQRILFEQQEHDRLSLWFEEFVTAVFYKNNKIVIGANFFIKRFGQRKGIFLLGSGGPTDYLDLLYTREFVLDDIRLFLQEILTATMQNTIILPLVHEDSPLNKWAIKSRIRPYYINTCVHIENISNYDSYWLSLNKGVRQNIRTARNHLIKENKKFEFIVLEDQKIDSNVLMSLKKIYSERRKEKDRREFKKNLLLFLKKWRFQNFDVIETAMLTCENSFTGIFKIEGNIAAYCYGLSLKDKIYIIRVAINKEYKRYSPGILLLQDIIKKMNENKLKHIYSLLDLTNGDELYKYQIGGVEHKALYYKIEKEMLCSGI